MEEKKKMSRKHFILFTLILTMVMAIGGMSIQANYHIGYKDGWNDAVWEIKKPTDLIDWKPDGDLSENITGLKEGEVYRFKAREEISDREMRNFYYYGDFHPIFDLQ